jgi:hypothetical protein
VVRHAVSQLSWTCSPYVWWLTDVPGGVIDRGREEERREEKRREEKIR